MCINIEVSTQKKPPTKPINNHPSPKNDKHKTNKTRIKFDAKQRVGFPFKSKDQFEVPNEVNFKTQQQSSKTKKKRLINKSQMLHGTI